MKTEKMTKEELQIARKVLQKAYTIINKECKGLDAEAMKEELFDDFIEFDNGYSEGLLRDIDKIW